MFRLPLPRLPLAVVLLLLLLGSPPAPAAPPEKIGFQGRLTNATGNPVNGTVNMTFRLYTLSEGGTADWTQGPSPVVVTGGLYSVFLGDTPFTGLDFKSTYYLGVQVEGDAEMSPRYVLLGGAFAMRSKTAENADLLGGLDASAFASAAHGHAHAALSGLSADDHSQYALLGGRSASQTLYGGNASGLSLTLSANSVDTQPAFLYLSPAGRYAGIGTTTPERTLDVWFLTGQGHNGIGLKNTDGAGRHYVIDVADAQGNPADPTGLPGFAFGIVDMTAGRTRLVITQDGKVGIGKTEPLFVLDVAGDAQITGNVSMNNALAVTGNISTNAAVTASALNVMNDATIGGNVDMTNGRLLNIGTGGSSFTAAGGLSLTAPLQVADGTQGAGKVLASDAAGLATWSKLTDLGTALGTGTQNYVTKWTNTNSIGNSLIVDNGTNIGIGTTSPAQKLDVSGNLKVLGTAVSGAVGIDLQIAQSSSSKGGKIYLKAGDAPNNWSANHWGGDIEVAGGGGYNNSGGDVFIRSGTTSTWSQSTVPTKVEIAGGTTDGSAVPCAYLDVEGAKNVTGNGQWNQSGGNILLMPGTHLGAGTVDGNVGIGTTAPTAKLDVAGQVKIQGGSPGAGKILSSDAVGLATWSTLNGLGGVSGSGTANYLPKWTGTNVEGNSQLYDNGQDVGIGTASPAEAFHISRFWNGRNMVAMIENTGPFSGAGFRMKTQAVGNDWQWLAHETGSGTADGLQLFNVTSGQQILTFKAGTYNLGLGTNTPGQRLTVAGGSALIDANQYYYTGDTNWGLARLDAGSLPASNMGITSNALVLKAGESAGQGWMFRGQAGTLRAELRGTDGSFWLSGDIYTVAGKDRMIRSQDVGSGSGNGGALTLQAGTAGTATGGAGGNVTIQAGGNMPQGGAGWTNLGAPGAVNIYGSSGYNSVGGGVNIAAGPTSYWAIGTVHSDVSIKGGTGINSGDPGSIVVQGGFAGNNNSTYSVGGSLVLTAGTGQGGGASGTIQLLNGNVGIGTATPGAKLEVTGQVKITGGAPGAGKVLTSDAVGLATWATPTGGITGSGTANYLSKWASATAIGNSLVFDNGTSVGIGTTTPGATLDVSGTGKFSGTVSGAAPTAASHFVTRGYADATYSPAAGGGYVMKAGDTMSGPLTLPGNPTAALHASTKQYTDAANASQDASIAARWSLTGNAGTTSGTHFLGTTDLQALELKVGNARALRLVPGSTSPNLIGGSAYNIAGGADGVTIAGGGSNGSPNVVNVNFGTIGGGQSNSITGGTHGVIGGGGANVVSNISTTVGGGWANNASGDSAVIAGGNSNSASGMYASITGGSSNDVSSNYGIVGGGENNHITAGTHGTIGGGGANQTSNNASTVGGGWANNVSGDSAVIAGGNSNTASGAYATVPGGSANAASGQYSLAAGRRAKASHDGAFVWADSTDADFASQAGNQFLIRAVGGVGIGIDNPAAALDVSGTGRFSGTVSGADPTAAAHFVNKGYADANYAPAAGGGYVMKTGDTMSGALNLPANGLAAGGSQLVLTGGFVGIGTNAPAHMLTVAGGSTLIDVNQYHYLSDTNFGMGRIDAPFLPASNLGITANAMILKAGEWPTQGWVFMDTHGAPRAELRVSDGTLSIGGDFFFLPGQNRSILSPDLGGGSGDGGTLTLRAGTAGSGSGGAGGNVAIQAGGNMPLGGSGWSNLGTSGAVTITGGGGYNSVGGNVTLQGGPTSYWAMSTVHSDALVKGGQGNFADDAGRITFEGGYVGGTIGDGTAQGGNVVIAAGIGHGYPNGTIQFLNGNVGIRTSSPGAALDVAGQVRIQGGSPGAGKVLSSDAAGLASWSTLNGLGGVTGAGTTNYLAKWTGSNTEGSSLIYDNGTNIGIGTTGPSYPLHISRFMNGQTMTTMVENQGSFSGAGYRMKTPAANNDWSLIAHENGSGTADGFKLFNGGTQVLVIKPVTFNLGLGTTSPGQKLTISGGSALIDANQYYYTGDTNWGLARLDAGSLPASNLGITSNALVLKAGESAGQGWMFRGQAGTLRAELRGTDGSFWLSGDIYTVAGKDRMIRSQDVGSGSGNGGALTLQAGTAGTATGGAGGNVTIQAGGNMPQGGAGWTNLGAPGAVNIYGSSGYNSVGGGVNIAAGPTSYWAIGTVHSDVSIKGGTGINSGDPGSIVVQGGFAGNNNSTYSVGGSLVLTAGTGQGGGASGTIQLLNGNVGIGTSSPTQRLDVSGNVKVLGTASAGSTGIDLQIAQSPSSKGGKIYLKAGDAPNNYSSNHWGGDIEVAGGGGYNNSGGDVFIRSGTTSTWSQSTVPTKVEIAGGTTDGSAVPCAYLDVEGAKNVTGNGQWNQSGGNILLMPGTHLGAGTVDGNVGIGTTAPTAKLDVAGQVKIQGGSPGAGKILTSDASGLASWQPLPNDEIILATHNGFGSTYTTVPRFSTVVTNAGSALTYSDSATDGTSIAVNTTGVYFVSIIYKSTWNDNVAIRAGVMKNATSEPGLSSANQLCFVYNYDNISTAYQGTSATVYLAAGDVVRPFMDRPNNNESRFEIRRVR